METLPPIFDICFVLCFLARLVVAALDSRRKTPPPVIPTYIENARRQAEAARREYESRRR